MRADGEKQTFFAKKNVYQCKQSKFPISYNRVESERVCEIERAAGRRRRRPPSEPVQHVQVGVVVEAAREVVPAVLAAGWLQLALLRLEAGLQVQRAQVEPALGRARSRHVRVGDAQTDQPDAGLKRDARTVSQPVSKQCRG